MQTDQISAFTSLRPWLHSLAFQLLGSGSDADDMVQECFLRWQRTDLESVRCPKAFLTTVMTRLCLKHLQSSRVRRERSWADIPESALSEQATDPSDYARLAESLSFAVFVMLETLAPVERAVFLLREVFDCDYDEIGAILGKRPENCRQILSRARGRIAGRQSRFVVSPQRHEEALQCFLHACSSGNWRQLLEAMADDAELICDSADLGSGATRNVKGASAITEFIKIHAATWLPQNSLLQTIQFRNLPIVIANSGGRPVSGILVAFSGGLVTRILIITCPVRLRSLTLQQRCQA